MKLLGLVIFLFSASAWSTPDWTKGDSFNRNGKMLTVICKGEAPLGASDLARKQALQECRNSAISQLQTDFSQKSLTIETEQVASFHSETVTNQHYSGVDCDMLKNQIEDSQDEGITRAFIKCRFDLSKAKVSSNSEKENQTQVSENIVSKIQETKTEAVNVDKSVERTANQQLTISSIPKCDTIIFKGSSRSIKCDSNPITVLVFLDDTEIIIRKNGFKPRHISLIKDRKIKKSKEIEQIEVYFEK